MSMLKILNDSDVTPNRESAIDMNTAHKIASFFKCCALCVSIFVSHCVYADGFAPLVDGNCEEYIHLKAETNSVSQHVTLYVYQDSHYVWICYSYPAGSSGTLDMALDAPNLSSVLNLHVSAQLGEWPIDKPELAPQEPTSNRWWNMKGWISNPVWLNGLIDLNGKPKINFKNASAREIQLNKAHFGRGAWRFRLHIRSILGDSAELYSIEYPKNGLWYELKAN